MTWVCHTKCVVRGSCQVMWHAMASRCCKLILDWYISDDIVGEANSCSLSSSCEVGLSERRKDHACLRRRSTLLSLPVLSRVVMARVAMLRFWSEIRLSMSMLQLVTAMGWVIATLFSVRTAANLQPDTSP